MIVEVAIHKFSSARRALQELQNILETSPQDVALGIDYINASISKALCCARSFLHQLKPSVAPGSHFETRMKISPDYKDSLDSSKLQRSGNTLQNGLCSCK